MSVCLSVILSVCRIYCNSNQPILLKCGITTGPTNRKKTTYGGDPVADMDISATVESNNFKFSTQLGFGVQLAKNNFQNQNLRVWAREASQEFGTASLFQQRFQI